jgi:hypothetical protein
MKLGAGIVGAAVVAGLVALAGCGKSKALAPDGGADHAGGAGGGGAGGANDTADGARDAAGGASDAADARDGAGAGDLAPGDADGATEAGPSEGGAEAGGDAADGPPPTSYVILPDATGRFTVDALGITGAWYAFSDGFGPDGSGATGTCQQGGHAPGECSVVTSPPPGSFAPTDLTIGKMCTAGTVAKVVNGGNGMPDYTNISGAGIALDLLAPAGSAAMPYNATAHGILGIAFDIDQVPLPSLRVEFPDAETAPQGIYGADYWGATTTFPPSPIAPGTNVVRFAQVTSPMAANPPFDPTMLLSIRFHVATTIGSAGPYSFCISRLTLRLLP